MIKQMKKLSIVVLNSNVDKVLSRLQTLGVVHLDIKKTVSEKLLEKINIRKRLLDVVKHLSKYPKTEQNIFSSDMQDFLNIYDEITSNIDVTKAKIQELNKTKSLLEPWGNFDLDVIEKLEQKGLYILYYKLYKDQFKKLDLSKHYFEIIKEHNSDIYFVVIQTEEQNLLNIDNIRFPEISLSECKHQLLENENILEKLEGDLKELAQFTDCVQHHVNIMNDHLTFEQALDNCDDYYDKKLSVISGWLPEDKVLELNKYLDKEKDLVFFIEDVSSKDNPATVPIQLKNDNFTKLFEPITKLFSLPSYKELDLTPFFAPFYVIFYGLCVGDSAYGLFIIIASVVAFIYFKKLKQFAIMGFILGVSVVFWGLITGTSLGFNLSESSVPVLTDLAVLKPVHLFYLSLMIGLFQILFGMLIKVFKNILNKDFLTSLAPLGWIMLVVSVSAIYLNPKSADDDFRLGRMFFYFIHLIPVGIAYITAIFGVLFILLFNDTKASLFLRMGKGLWELYGITGVVGDLLSYIRLFALGLSSAILGSVINMVAVKIFLIPVPVLSHVLFILFMVVGHFGNLAIAGLGAFVHPLRLTFVEFYKNAGFEGGGLEYRPFKKENIGSNVI